LPLASPSRRGSERRAWSCSRALRRRIRRRAYATLVGLSPEPARVGGALHVRAEGHPQLGRVIAGAHGSRRRAPTCRPCPWRGRHFFGPAVAARARLRALRDADGPTPHRRKERNAVTTPIPCAGWPDACPHGASAPKKSHVPSAVRQREGQPWRCRACAHRRLAALRRSAKVGPPAVECAGWNALCPHGAVAPRGAHAPSAQRRRGGRPWRCRSCNARREGELRRGERHWTRREGKTRHGTSARRAA